MAFEEGVSRVAPSAFAGYTYISLPDLSHTRKPIESTERLTTTDIHAECTEKHLIAALGRCLGVYCSSSDVALGWHAGGCRKAVRVRWEAKTSWQELMDDISPVDIPEEELRQQFELQEDQNLFLAIVGDELDIGLGFPLVASLAERQITLRYSTKYFHTSVADILASQVKELIGGIIASPNGSPKSLSFLSNGLQSRVDLSPNASSYTHVEAFKIITEAVTRQDPQSIAVEFYADLTDSSPPTSLSYGDLCEQSNKFAHYLISKGLEEEDKVAVCLPRGLEFHVVILGVWKAGGCYVPIDPELPFERRDYIVKDSKAKFVLSEDNLDAHLESANLQPSDDMCSAHPDSLSYMLYTSGTTGTPKGCLLTHRGLSEAILALSNFSAQADVRDGRYLAIASIAFDVHLAEILVPFVLGMTAICAPRSQLQEDLPQWIQKLRITHVGIVPSLIEATMNIVEDNDEESHLRYLASGGEKMSDSIIERWGHHETVRLANFYGPSEVTIGCAARFMSSSTRGENIGRIFENCSAYIVDENLNTVIRGGVGELLVGGPLVGRGYNGKPELTAKAFIEWEGTKAYRTGDLARLMPDDTLEIIGRIDTQIKLRGVRIESDGVSSIIRDAAFGVLKAKADVCTILARHPSIQTDQLVSFVAWNTKVSVMHRRSAKPRVLLTAPDGLISASRKACNVHLASYMRPAHIVPLEFMPMNSNGKTDTKLLLSIFQSESLETLGAAASAHSDNTQLSNGNSDDRPPNDIEQILINIICRLTEVPSDDIRVSSNLFQLGFDSLKLVHLTTQIRDSLSLTPSDLSVADLMNNATLSELATLLVSREKRDEAGEKAVSSGSNSLDSFEQKLRPEVEKQVVTSAIESILPTFPLQDGVLYRSSAEDTLYVQHVVMRLREGTSIDRLRAAWRFLQERYDILRTIFHFSKNTAQVVLKADGCNVPWHEKDPEDNDDAQDLFARRFVDGVGKIIAAEINDSVSSMPPFRLFLHRRRANVYLTLSIHHAIFDGTSLEQLIKECEAAYFNKAVATTAPLSTIISRIRDIDIQKAERFWKDRFKGFQWPRMATTSVSNDSECRTTAFRFETRLENMKQLAAKAKVSLHTFLTATFSVSLNRHLYARDDIVFGTIRSGRSFADAYYDNSQCPLLSVLPTRVTLNGDVGFLQEVQRHAANELEYAHIPLSSLQQWLRPGQALFDVLFSISIKSSDHSELWETVLSSQPTADYPLAVEIIQMPDLDEIRVEAAFTSTMPPETVSLILQDIEKYAISLGNGSKDISDSETLVRPQIPSQTDSSDDLSELDGDDEIDVDEDLEKRLLDTISQFMGTDSSHISTRTSLIGIGLDSIKCIGLSRILKNGGLKISAVDLMKYSTIHRIARHISRKPNFPTKEEVKAISILKSLRDEIHSSAELLSIRSCEDDSLEFYPVTDLQAGMLSQTVNVPGNLYIHGFPFRLPLSVELGKLRDAWVRTVQQCTMLRTSFHFLVELGQWIQAVHSRAHIEWAELEEDSDKSIAEIIEEFIESGALSSESALARSSPQLLLLRPIEADRPATLVLILHHALYDGISISVMRDMVETFYQDKQVDQPHPFQDLLGQFLFQERHGTQFWVDQLSGFARPIWPNVEAKDSQRSQSASYKISISQQHALEATKVYGVSIQCLGQLVMAEQVGRLCGTRDVVFGHVVSGRSESRAERTIGPLITTVPCRIRLSPHITVLDLVRSIHRNNIKALQWQHASLRSIQRSMGQRTLWDSIFLFQPNLENEDNSDHILSSNSAEDTIPKLQYGLNVELHQHNNNFILRVACLARTLTEHGLRQFVHEFASRFKEIVDIPSGALVQTIDDAKENTTTSLPADPRRKHCDNRVIDEKRKEYNTIVDILSSCMKVPASRMDPHLSLISMGIDSISAIQIAAKCRQSGIRLHATQILQCETIYDVVQCLEEKDDASTRPQDDSVAVEMVPTNIIEAFAKKLMAEPAAIESVYPASAGMQWLIAMWQISYKTRFQHAFAFRLPIDVDLQRFESAWREVVRRYPILRSTFASDDGRNVDVVVFKELPKDRLWLTNCILEDGDEEELLVNYMKQLVSSPLTTDRPPSQAIMLLCNGFPYFILHLHHFQYDAWSLNIVVDELRSLYMSNEEPANEVAIHELNSFLRFCHASSSALLEQERYWRQRLPATFGPSLFTLQKPAGNSPARSYVIVRSALVDVMALRDRTRAISCSMSAVFIACWAIVQSKTSGKPSATFGLWQNGRSNDLDDIERMAIPCMNVLPFHLECERLPLADLCREVQTQLRERSGVIEQTSLMNIAQWSECIEAPLFNVCLNILDSRAETEANKDVLEPVEVPYFIPEVPSQHTTSLDNKLAVSDLIQDTLMVDIVVNEDVVDMSVEFYSSYLENEDAHRLVHDWRMAVWSVLNA